MASYRDRIAGFQSAARVITWLLLAAAINFLYCTLTYPKLSSLKPAMVLSEVSKGTPIQGQTDRPVFNFDYRGRSYGVRPQASYELYGLVVSKNDPTGWGDIYHDEDSVDFRDLCVVWGDNALSLGVGFEFYSEPWTCFVSFKSEFAAGAFSSLELSNNHLLGGSETSRKLINSVQIGDQIFVRGMLVDYWDKESPESIRVSSLRRDDNGNGACEVFFVEDAVVLKRYEPARYKGYQRAKLLLQILIVIKLASIPLIAYAQYRSI